MRQVAQLTQVLARVLFLRRERRYDEAQEEIRRAGELFFGLDLSDARTITYADVMAALEAKNLAAVEGTSHAAELLRQSGELDALTGNPEDALHRLRLALQLYLDLFTREGGVQSPDYVERIDVMLAQVDPYALPPDVMADVVGFYEATGRFDMAENVLFVLAEHPTEAVYELGVAFYERLRRKTNAKLMAGGLSREEVVEGRTAFEALCAPVRKDRYR